MDKHPDRIYNLAKPKHMSIKGTINGLRQTDGHKNINNNYKRVNMMNVY